MQDLSTVGLLERQANKIIPVPQAMSPSLFQLCAPHPCITDTFNTSSPGKQQKNNFPTVSFPRHSKISEICDPKSVINGLIIGDNPETTGMVSHSDIEQTDTGDMLASSVLKKRKKKMNKHKYKKRRARDKFKRLNLQNIKDRKQRAKDRAKERMKSSA